MMRWLHYTTVGRCMPASFADGSAKALPTQKQAMPCVGRDEEDAYAEILSGETRSEELLASCHPKMAQEMVNTLSSSTAMVSWCSVMAVRVRLLDRVDTRLWGPDGGHLELAGAAATVFVGFPDSSHRSSRWIGGCMTAWETSFSVKNVRSRSEEVEKAGKIVAARVEVATPPPSSRLGGRAADP